MGTRILKKRNPNTTYVFQVRAKNMIGEVSAWSDPPFKLITDKAPELAPPTKVEAWALPLLNMIHIFWSNARIEQGRHDIVCYRVYRGTTNDKNSATEIAEVKGLFHIDYSKDYKGTANASSSGSSLHCSLGTFKPTMNGQKILNMGTFASPKTSSGTVAYVNGTTLTASLSGGDTWEEHDRFIIDYTPLRNQQYYYWVTSVSQEGRESEKSESDGAKLGKPNDAIIDSFIEDESEDFLWLKGWAMTFHCPDGAEGYYLQWKLKNSLIWSPPTYVPHEGEPDDAQTHVFKNKVVGREYTFSVRAVNHLVYRDYWQTIPTESSDVIKDAGRPEPPQNLRLFQGPFNNWIAWKQSSSNDVKDYQIFRKQKTGISAPTLTAIDLENPYVASWPSASSFFIDPLSGMLDGKNWYYWIGSRDWFNNKSYYYAGGATHGLAGPVGEVETPRMVELGADNVTQLLFGVKLTWDKVDDAIYYKIYRSLKDDPNTANCICPFWIPNTYIDLFAKVNMPLLQEKHYYWVNAVGATGVEALFAGTGAPATPDVPDINTNTTGTLPQSRLELNYDTIYLNVKDKLTITATDINNKISTIDITPKSITLKSGGDITLSTTGNINCPTGANIKFDSSTIYSNTSSMIIAPNASNKSLVIGMPSSSLRWNYMRIECNDLVVTSSQRNILFSTAERTGSQIQMRLPIEADGAVKHQWSLMVDYTTPDANGNYPIKAKWISP